LQKSGSFENEHITQHSEAQQNTEIAETGKLPPVEVWWKASWMLLLWLNEYALVSGRARMRSIHPKNPLVGIPQGYAIGRGWLPSVQQRKKRQRHLRCL